MKNNNNTIIKKHTSSSKHNNCNNINKFIKDCFSPIVIFFTSIHLSSLPYLLYVGGYSISMAHSFDLHGLYWGVLVEWCQLCWCWLIYRMSWWHQRANLFRLWSLLLSKKDGYSHFLWSIEFTNLVWIYLITPEKYPFSWIEC